MPFVFCKQQMIIIIIIIIIMTSTEILFSKEKSLNVKDKQSKTLLSQYNKEKKVVALTGKTITFKLLKSYLAQFEQLTIRIEPVMREVYRDYLFYYKKLKGDAVQTQVQVWFMKYIPYIKQKINDAKSKLEKQNYGQFVLITQDVPTLIFQQFYQKIAGQNVKSLACGASEIFIKNNPDLFIDLKQTCTVFIAARNAISSVGLMSLGSFMLQSQSIIGQTLSPTGILLTMVPLYLKFGKNFQPRKLPQKTIKIQWGQMQKITNNQPIITDFLGFKSYFPIDQKYALTGLTQLQKQLVSQGVGYASDTIAKYLKFFQDRQTEIQGYIIEVKKDQQNVKNDIQNLQLQMVQQGKQEQQNKINNQIKKANTVAIKAEQLQKQINKNFQQVYQEKIQIAVPDVEKLQNKNQLQTAASYFQAHFKSFKIFKKSQVSMQDLYKYPADISIAIVLAERRKRLLNTKILNYVGKVYSKIKASLTDSTVTQGTIMKLIKQQQSKVALIIQEFSLVPQSQIQILVQKGKRLNRQISIIQQTSRTTQGLNQEATVLKQKVQFIQRKIDQIYGDSGVIKQIITQGFQQSNSSLNSLKQQLDSQKYLLSQFNSQIELGLVKMMDNINQKITVAYQQVVQQFKYQLNLMQGRLNLELTQIKKQVLFLSQQIKKIYKSLTQISQNIAQIKIDIEEIKQITKRTNQQAGQIRQALQNFINALRVVGFQAIYSQNQNANTRLQQIKKQTNKKVNDFRQYLTQSLQPIDLTRFKQQTNRSIESITKQLAQKVNQTKNTVNQKLNNLTQNLQPINLSSFRQQTNKSIQSITQQFAQKVNETKEKTSKLMNSTETVLTQNIYKLMQNRKVLQQLLKQNNFQNILKSLPTYLNQLINKIKTVKLLDQEKQQNLAKKLDRIDETITNLTQSLVTSNPGGSGGSGGSGDNNYLILQEQLKQVKLINNQLKNAVIFLFNLSKQMFNQQSQFLSDFLKDKVQKKQLDIEVANLVLNQLIQRYQMIKSTFMSAVQEKVSTSIFNQLKRIKQWPIQQNPFNWWDKQSKKIKF